MLKKFLIGTFVVALMFVGAVALTTKTASAAPQAIVTVADIQYAATVRSGSSGQASLIWQNFLNGYSTTANLVADGKFGPLSEVQAKAWQASRGLVADGVLGAMSRAAAMAQIQSGTPASAYPAGCTSTVGYSSVTGLPCVGVTYPAGCGAGTLFSATTGLSCVGVVVVLPAGCSVGAAFSATTGLSCAGTTTTTTTTTTTNGVLVGGAGDVTITETSTDVEDVALEGQATKVLGFKAEAFDSDVSITNVKVTLENLDAPTTSSYRLTNYVDSVDIYMGSTKVGSANAADFSKSLYTYTKSIALTDAIVREGTSHKATFYVVLNAASNIDSTDMTNAEWDVTASNIRFQDATGVIMTNGDTDPAVTGLKFSDLATSGDVKLTISKGSGSPLAQTVEVSDTSSTSDVLMLEFKLKATGSDLSFDTLTFDLTGVVADANKTLATMITDMSLVNGSDTLASDPTISATDTGTAVFDLDDTFTITKDTTETFRVYAKIADVGATTLTSGDSLKVALAKAGIATEDSNGDVVLTLNETGSATGAVQTFSTSSAVVSAMSWTSTTVAHAGSLDFFFTVSSPENNFDVLATEILDNVPVPTGTFVACSTVCSVSGNGTLTKISGDPVDPMAIPANGFTVPAGSTSRFQVHYGTVTTGTTAVTITSVAGQAVPSDTQYKSILVGA